MAAKLQYGALAKAIRMDTAYHISAAVRMAADNAARSVASSRPPPNSAQGR